MKSIITYCLALLLVGTACPGLFAGTTITGQVLDKDKKPISHVNIQSRGILVPTESDEDGMFSISLNDDNPAKVVFSHIGYIPRSITIAPQEQTVSIVLSEQVFPLEGITVTTGRTEAGQAPVAEATIDAEDIDRDFDIGEVPALLETTPNLYSYSDAGGGLGYSYLMIRGFDARRTPVYINGVPLNDPEDHALYFIDLPDFASHADNIQVQRGAGNALYGDAAFGGSVNILTSPLVDARRFTTEFGYGGFLHDGETVGLMRKSSVGYSTGLLEGGWSLTGRWVQQYSDGYREKSWYDGSAYYLSIGRLDPGMITTLNIYGGPMKTHAAWDGIDRATLESNRRANPYTYDNETDNFNQPHFELHNIYNINDHLTLNNTLYHIRGKGYYEQLKDDQSLDAYGLSTDPDATSNLVRRKWVDKIQWGLTSQLAFDGERQSTSVGASYYYFESEHWGEVIWAEALSPSLLDINAPHRYYEYFGTYHNLSLFSSRIQQIGERLSLSGQLQLRYLHKDIATTPMGLYEERRYNLDWLFLSPRLGATYLLADSWSVFTGFSIASHEPNDDMIDDADDPGAVPRLEVIDASATPIVYGDPTVGAERLYNFELGIDYRTSRLTAAANLFWMEYRNEIVPDGGLTDDGFPTYGNADRSIHRGIELSGDYRINRNFIVEGNLALNDNIIKSYDQQIYDWGTGATTVVKHRDVAVPNFPKYLGNLMLDYSYGPARFVYRLRAIGRQFVSVDGRYFDRGAYLEDVSIAPHTISSIKTSVVLGKLLGGADLSIEGRVENLFNVKYETFGYKWGDWFAYWPGAERNWYVNFKLAI